MSQSQGEIIWKAFTEEQQAVIQSELIVVYTEVLNDFINSNQTTSLGETSNHLCPPVDRATNNTESREPVDAVRAA